MNVSEAGTPLRSLVIELRYMLAFANLQISYQVCASLFVALQLFYGTLFT